MKLPSKRFWMYSSAVALLGATVPFGGVAFAQAKPQMADDVFKNIKVLKGLTVDEFMGTMGLFSAALNVCCGDCHVGAGGSNPQWEKDPPRKLIARHMVDVMNKVNKESFGGRQVVTCWTCHRGTTPPATTPAIDAIYSDPVPMYPDVLPQAAAGAVVPSIDQILDKYLQALGGAGALAKITSYSGTGTSTTFGADQMNKAEIFAKAPDKYVTVVHQREGDMIRTTDGHDAWVVLPLTVTGEYQLTASAAEGGKLDGELAFPGDIKSFFNTWRVSYPGNYRRPRRQCRSGQRSARFYRNLLFRQADRPADAHGALRQFGGGTRSHANRFRGLSSGGGSDDALQADVRMGERPRRVYVDRHHAECRGGRFEVHKTTASANAAQMTAC